MIKNFEGLLEKAKTSKKLLKHLKQCSVIAQDFELAAELRGMETSLFPETEGIKKDKELAKQLNLVFRMADLSVDDKNCLLIYKLIKAWEKKKGKFSMDEAISINFNVSDTFE